MTIETKPRRVIYTPVARGLGGFTITPAKHPNSAVFRFHCLGHVCTHTLRQKRKPCLFSAPRAMLTLPLADAAAVPSLPLSAATAG